MKDPKKYGFDPKQLVLAIVEFTVRLDGVAGNFAEALAGEDDYDAGVMERARDLLIQHTLGAALLPPKMFDIIAAVASLRGGGAATTPGKTAGDGDVMSPTLGDVMSPGAAPQDPEAAAHALLAALGPEPEGYDWEAAYKSGMESLGTFGEVDCGVPIRDFFSQFDKNSKEDDARAVSPSRRSRRSSRESPPLFQRISSRARLGPRSFSGTIPTGLIACARSSPGREGRRTAAVVSCLTFTFRRATPRSLRW